MTIKTSTEKQQGYLAWLGSCLPSSKNFVKLATVALVAITAIGMGNMCPPVSSEPIFKIGEGRTDNADQILQYLTRSERTPSILDRPTENKIQARRTKMGQKYKAQFQGKVDNADQILQYLAKHNRSKN